jgi:hypothetical protein
MTSPILYGEEPAAAESARCPRCGPTHHLDFISTLAGLLEGCPRCGYARLVPRVPFAAWQPAPEPARPPFDGSTAVGIGPGICVVCRAPFERVDVNGRPSNRRTCSKPCGVQLMTRAALESAKQRRAEIAARKERDCAGGCGATFPAGRGRAGARLRSPWCERCAFERRLERQRRNDERRGPMNHRKAIAAERRALVALGVAGADEMTAAQVRAAYAERMATGLAGVDGLVSAGVRQEIVAPANTEAAA